VTQYNQEAEGGTYILQLAFTDETGAAATPTSATVTLTDEQGAIVNSRDDVAISPLAANTYVVLNGNDLLLTGGQQAVRTGTIKAAYNSATYGSNLPLRATHHFIVLPVPDVP